ncbi:hypothetical protein XENORESO_002602 [Xenotaenia resolanae]|uniref:Uncharacterized protein n=1 Tax=Xenotaenia resolanae TaxID=208358 RepID=A0ABV0W4A2_9TELE
MTDRERQCPASSRLCIFSSGPAALLLPSQRAERPAEDGGNNNKKNLRFSHAAKRSQSKTADAGRKKMNEWLLDFALLCTDTGRRGMCIRKREEERKRME